MSRDALDLLQLGGAIERVLKEPGLFQVTFSAVSSDGMRLRVTISIDLRKATLTAVAMLKALSWASRDEVHEVAAQ